MHVLTLVIILLFSRSLKGQTTREMNLTYGLGPAPVRVLTDREYIDTGFPLLSHIAKEKDGKLVVPADFEFTTIDPKDYDDETSMVEPEPFPELSTQTNTISETNAETETEAEPSPLLDGTTVQANAVPTVTISSTIGIAIRGLLLLALLLLLL